jgi:hypothetical protein
MGAMRSSARTIRRFVASRGAGSALSAADKDGAVEFTLSACPHGICVERRQLRVGAGLASHAMRFRDESSFLAWCEADVLKYSYPLVYSSLKRHGCALLATDQPGTDAA